MDKTDTPSVLVIDDEKGLRDMLMFSLSGQGYRVVTAADGAQAVELARREAPDLALCDIMMPGGMDGLQTLKAIKELCPGTEVVMATGYASLETAIGAMKLGAYDYITKPYNLDDLGMVLGKALEHKRLKTQVGELEELNRLKSEFLANMSHELRTPLNAIVGYTSLMLDKAYGDVPEKQGDALRRVFLNSKNLLGLINNILDLSKLNAGMMPMFIEEFDLAAVMEEVVDTMQSLALGKRLALTWEGPRLRVKSDKTKIKQILINLVGNALKFTEQGGVAVSAEPSADGAQATLRVRDTGCGMAEEDIPRIFEEFRQLDGGADRKHGGTGLGLSITKKLARILGGDVAVESEVGKGSTFQVTLPRGIVQPQQGPFALASNFPPREEEGQKILLAIDDDPEVLRILNDSLAGTGYRMVGALSGVEGLALARQVKPFAITLDIMMPHNDGWSVLQMIKKDPELRSIPVMILSIMENKALGYALGVTDYLVKPIERQALVEKLKALEAVQHKKVLVVEDEEETLSLFKRALTDDGYDVRTACTGRQALALLKEARPDILFLDLNLPDMSGFEILQAIDQSPGLKGLPVIVMTAQNLSRGDAQRLDRRVELVIQKGSVSISEIMAELRKRLTTISGGVHV